MSIITLAEFKSYAEISNPKHDTKLQALVDFVNSYIENFCNVEFSETIVLQKKLTSTNGIDLLIPYYPLVSVQELRYNGDVVDPSIYEVNTDLGSIDSLTYFGTKRFAFEVDFTYGYSAVPADLKLAAMELVAHYQKREFTKSRNLGNGESATYEDSQTIPSHIRMVLNMYRVL